MSPEGVERSTVHVSCLFGTCSPRVRELAVQPVLSVLTTAVLLLLDQAKGDNFDCPFDGIPKPAVLVVPPILSYRRGFEVRGRNLLLHIHRSHFVGILKFVLRTEVFADAIRWEASVLALVAFEGCFSVRAVEYRQGHDMLTF